MIGIGLWMVLKNIRLSTAGWLGIFWLIAVWQITYFSHLNSGFVAKDEYFFATKEIKDHLSNRALWILLNQITGLFTQEVINTMRVFNLGFVILLYIVCLRAFSTIHPFIIALAISYVSCVAALNLRDPGILLGVVLFLVKRGEVGANLADQFYAFWRCRWSIVLLCTLRPLQATLLVLAGLKLYMIAGVMVLSVVFLQSPLGSRYFFNFAYHTQNFSESISDKAESKGLSSTDPTPSNIAFWMSRFIFAPSPGSILRRFLFEPDGYSYGRVDLGVRVINRSALYCLFLAIIVYTLREPSIVLKTFRDNSFVFKFGLLFSFLYAVFNFGASHERIKMTLVVLALYMVDRIRRDIQASLR